MRQTKKIICSITKEFQANRFCFDHEPPNNFVKSQWQNCTKSWIYLAYRCFMALFFIVVVIQSIVDHILAEHTFLLYFIYLTHWGILMCMMTNSLGAVLVGIWHFHPEYADQITDTQSMPRAFKIYWALHIITLIASIIITIVYWTFLYNSETILSTTNILTHALNSILMFLDLLIVAYPVRLLHIFFPMSFGITYAIFTVIYYFCGGVDIHGNSYVYEILDWKKPKNSLITVIGVILLCCFIYMIIFSVYKIRIFIYKRYKKFTLFLPTSTSTSTKHQTTSNDLDSSTPPIVTHPPNGISMVLGDFGIQNQGFRYDEKL